MTRDGPRCDRSRRVGAGLHRPPSHLFVYGTLLPGEVRWSLLEPYVSDRGTVDSAAGSLYDTGLEYPAAVFGGRSVILGRMFTIEPSVYEECLADLDIVEGTVGGLYSRIVVSAGSGIDAWAYEYGGGLELVRIASGDWLHR
ncbi:MAG: gamma-glutamylcyclotransferase family protein [Acidimicrobiia bacterium]|nr:gamma-glutamylcyclotransferase family protein [Acidimicrobiia bacterium]